MWMTMLQSLRNQIRLFNIQIVRRLDHLLHGKYYLFTRNNFKNLKQLRKNWVKRFKIGFFRIFDRKKNFICTCSTLNINEFVWSLIISNDSFQKIQLKNWDFWHSPGGGVNLNILNTLCKIKKSITFLPPCKIYPAPAPIHSIALGVNINSSLDFLKSQNKKFLVVQNENSIRLPKKCKIQKYNPDP